MADMMVEKVRGRGRVLVLLLVGMGLALLLDRSSGAQDPAWGDEDVLSVVSVQVREGLPTEVTVAWPAPEGRVDTIRVIRDGEVIGSVTSTEDRFVDADPRTDGAPAEYSAVATAEGQDVGTLGRPMLHLGDVPTGCSITWTGAVPGAPAWEDARNWAPIVDGPGTAEPRAPGPDDDACIIARQQLPVEVAAPSGAVGSLHAPAGINEPVLRVAGGDLEVTGDFLAQRLQLDAGTLALRSGGEVQASAGVNLQLHGGRLELGGHLAVTNGSNGEVRVDGPGAVELVGGSLEADLFRVGPPGVGLVADATVTAAEGHVLTARTTTVNGSAELRNGAGGGGLRTDTLDVYRNGGEGATTVDWTVAGRSGAPGPDWIRVRDSSDLTVSALAALDGDTVLDGTELRVEGPLRLRQEVTAIERLRLTGPQAALVPAPGTEGALERIDELLMGRASLRVQGDLRSRLLDIEDSELVVDGTVQPLDGSYDMRLVRSTLTVGSPLVLDPASQIDLFFGASTIDGDLVVAGQLPLDRPVDVTVFPDLTVTGDLTIADGGAVLLAGDRSILTVGGALAIEPGGTLRVDLDDPVVPGTPRRMAEAGSTEGDDTGVVLTGPGAADALGELRDDGAWVRHREDDPDPGDPGDPDDCATALPAVLGLALEGCWADRGDGVYVAGIAATPEGSLPRIGGLVLEPTAGVLAVLDLSDPAAPSLRTVLEADEATLGAVSVTVPVLDGADVAAGGAPRAAGRSAGGAALSLGTFALDWDLAAPIELAHVAELLGLPLPGGLDLAVVDGQWVVTVAAQLPDLLGATAVPLSFPVGPRGVDPGDLSLEGIQTIVLAELTRLRDLSIAWVADQVWSIASDVGDPFGIDGTVTYDGGLESGTLVVSGLAVGGIGDPDTTVELTFDRGTSTWSGLYLDGDGARFSVEVRTSGSDVVEGTIELAGVELGLVEVEQVVLRHQEGSWTLDGSASSPAGEAAISGSLQVVGGRLVGLELTLVGAVGPFARLDPLTITATPDAETLPDGTRIPEGTRLYAVQGTVHSGGETSTVDGALLLATDTSAVRGAWLDVDLALGELAHVSGHLSLDPQEQVWSLTGREGAPEATLTCEGGTSGLSGSLALSGGTATAGTLTGDGLCFGVTPLERLKLVVDTDDDGTTVVVEAAIAQPAGDEDIVSGRLHLVDGRIEEGHLSLPALTIDGLVQTPPVQLDVSREGAIETWSVTTDPRIGALRLVELSFTDGDLVGGDLWWGPDGHPSPPALSLGDWLVVETFRLTYEGGEGSVQEWTVDGQMAEPDVAIDGDLVLVDGRIVAGSLHVDGAEIGPLARLDLTLTVDAVVDRRLALDGTVELDGGTSVQAAGELVLAPAGGLESGRLAMATLPVGELATLGDVELAFVVGEQWDLSGTVIGPDGKAGTPLRGSATFDDGELVEAELEIGRLSLGPASIHDLTFTLDRSRGGPRSGHYVVSGVVDSPVTSEPGKDLTASDAEPITGAVTMVDGAITELGITVPYLGFGSLAHLRDLDLSYRVDPDTGAATVGGEAEVVTAADTAPATGLLQATFLEGRLVDVRVEADPLPLGGLVDLRGLVATTVATGTCPGLSVEVPDPDRPDLRVWSVTATAGEDQTPVTGCLGIEEGRLVAAQLELGSVQLTDLIRLEDLSATYDDLELFEVPGSAGPVELSRTRLSLGATVRTGTADPLVVGGEATVIDGGLESLSLQLGSLPVMGGVELRDLSVAYAQPGRWDGESDTTFALSGAAHHTDGVTTVDGSFAFEAGVRGGRVEAAEVGIEGLPIGPFLVDRFALTAERTTTGFSWSVDGAVVADDKTFDVAGSAEVADGRVVAASVQLARLPVYDQVHLADVTLSYELVGERGVHWQGSGEVHHDGGHPPGGPASATVDLTLDGAGAVTEGEIEVEAVRWGGLVRIDQLRLATSQAPEGQTWEVSGSVAVGEGEPGTVAGELVLRGGRVLAGSLSLAGIPVADLATIDSLEIAGGPDGWAGTLEVTSDGATATGRAAMTWSEGRLAAAELELGGVPLTRSLALEQLSLSFPAPVGPLERWSAGGTIAHAGGSSSLGGSLAFEDGRLVGGGLTAEGVDLGPFTLTQLSLAAGQGVTLSACGIEAGGPTSTGLALSAVVADGDGHTTSLGGLLVVEAGRVTDGALCGDGIRVTELAVVDDVLLSFSGPTAEDPTETWSGTATVRHPGGSDASASLTIEIGADRRLSHLRFEAAGIRLEGLLELREVLIEYQATGRDTTTYQVAARLDRPGAGEGSTVTGILEVDQGVIVGGGLSIAEVPLGDLTVLEDVQISYVGRRATTSRPSSAEGLPFERTPVSGCGATPSGFNVPSGTPTTEGAESYFSVAASVRYRGDTYAARGSLGFDDGQLSAFDVTIACLPIGDVVRLREVRVAYATFGAYRLGGTMGIADRPDVTFYGNMTFDDGRLVGGGLKLGGVPLGVTTIDLLELQIGQNADGSSTWGAGLSLTVGDSTYGGSGSFTVDEGRITAGSLTVDTIPVFGLLDIEDLSLSYTETAAGVQLAGSGGVARPNSSSPSTASFSLDLQRGRLVGGSLSASNLLLFDALPIQGLSVGFTQAGGWTGSVETALDDVPSAPSIAIGVEVADGRLVGGQLGFDNDGDGEADAPGSGGLEVEGGGRFTAFPLKALFISYCPAGSTAAYCDGDTNGDVWKGGLAIELPTSAAPGISGTVTIRNGRLVGASLQVSGVRVPVMAGVYLTSIGALVEKDPNLRVEGSMGAEVGPPTGPPIVDLTGTIGFAERPDWDPSQGSYEEYQAEYLQFYLTANASIFGMPISAGGYLDVQTRGYVGLGGTITAEVKSWLEIYGGLHGAVFSNPGIGARNPDTGEPLTGMGFQIMGEAGLRMFGVNIASGEVWVNQIGVAGCAQVGGIGTGASTHWDRPFRKFRIGCNVGRVQIVEAISEFQGRSTRSVRSGAEPTHVVTVPPGETELEVKLYGETDLVDYALVAPDGTIYEEVTDDVADLEDEGYLLVRGADEQTGESVQVVFLPDPQPGEWQLVPRGGSAMPDEVTTARRLPDPEVEASVSPEGGRMALDYDILPIEDQEVAFFERIAGADDDFMAPIGTARPQPGPDGRSRTGEGDTAAGSITFTPAGSAEASEREIVAVILSDGMPRDEVVVATYTAPAAGPASAPTGLSVEEVGGGARVSWEPPTDLGGREVLSYQVRTAAGFTHTVEPDVTEVELAIPSMEPDDEVGVAVLAFTGVGPGEAATASFVASQSTDPVRLAIGEAGPDEPVDPTDPTDPVDPTDPTDPVDPTDPMDPDPTDPTDPVDPTEPVEPTDPTHPVEPVEPVEPTDPTDPTDPDPDPTDPTDPTDAGRSPDHDGLESGPDEDHAAGSPVGGPGASTPQGSGTTPPSGGDAAPGGPLALTGAAGLRLWLVVGLVLVVVGIRLRWRRTVARGLASATASGQRSRRRPPPGASSE